MTIKKKMLISTSSAFVIILLQNLLVFSTITEQSDRIFFVKIILECLLFVIYLSLTYVYVHSKFDYTDEKNKYNRDVCKMSFVTFIFFFAMSSAIFSNMELFMRVIFFAVGVISLLSSIYISWKFDNEKLKKFINNYDEK